MTSVDKRVVEMEFDNKQFQNGVTTSVKSLEDLKKGLDLSGAAKGLNDLDRAGKSFSLAGIANGVDTIASRFTTLGIIGVTTLVNITNAALNAGKNIISALSLDPIMSGFEEYETKMNAIQTILTNTASKGTKLEDVNKALAELNTYADKTIYNFAEMTRNIGTFTAAGVDLNTSVTAIKGIANLAAGSGSSALQASTAMYQLSQAIASGSVKLQDWNSVVNAGMGGELFQKALEKTAKELGHGRNMAVSFRDSLESGWITTEVLTKTLEKFANDESLIKAATQVKTFTQLFDTMKESVQSGWAISWENIIGNREQAAQLLTSINDAFSNLIGPSTDARNAMLAFWNANGGRDALIEGISNAFKGLMSIIKPISEAFREIFPPMTGQRLVELTKNFRDLTANFKIGDATISKIKSTFKGLFSVLDILGQTLGTVVKGIGMLIGAFLPAGKGILDVTSSLGEYITSIDQSIKTSGIFIGILEKFGKVASIIPMMFKGIEKIAPIFYKIGESIQKVFGVIKEQISKAFDGFTFEKFFVVLNAGLTAGILLVIRNFIKSLTSITKNAGGFLDGIKEILDGVKDCLSSYQKQLKAGALMKIAMAIGILAVSLTILASINPQRLASALAGITVLFVELFGSMAAFEKIVGGMGFKSLATITLGFLGLSTSILILSAALKNLSGVDWAGIIKGLIGIAGLSAILVVSAKLLSSNSAGMIKGSIGFVLFASSLLILTNAMQKIAGIDLEGLQKGILGIGAMLAELVIFMKLTDFSGLGVKSGLSIVLIAESLNILADAVSKFGSINTGALIQGLLSVGAILLGIALFVKLTGDSKKVISTAIGLTILATSLIIMSKAISDMGSMPTDVLVKGLLSLAAALIILGVALATIQSSIGTAASLLIVSAAMVVLAGAIKLLGSLSIGEIATALLTLVGVLVILGVAGLVLGPLVPVLLGVGASILLIGAGAALAGAGLLLVSAGISALSAALASLAGSLAFIVDSLLKTLPSLLELMKQAIIGFAQIIITTAPLVAQAILTLLLELLKTVVAFIPQLVVAGMQLILGLLQGIASNLPKIVTVAIDILLTFIQTINANMPRIVQAAFDMMITFINSLAEAIRKNTPTLLAAMRNLILALIQSGIQILTGSTGLYRDAGNLIITNLLNGIRNMVPAVLSAITGIPRESIVALAQRMSDFFRAGQNMIDGLIGGLKSKVGDLARTAANAAKSALDAAKAALGIHSPSKEFEQLGIYSNEGFANGLKNYSGVVMSAAKDMGKNTISTLGNAISNISDIVNGNMDMTPTIRPVVDLTNVKEGAGAINSMLSNNPGISLSTANKTVASISNGINTNTTDVQNGSTNSLQQTTPTGPRPAIFQLMLQNGKAIAEFVVDDLDSINGTKNNIAGRMVGV